ncbi:MAG: PKD domain-containing protein [Steroidobacteraceae bacterium]
MRATTTSAMFGGFAALLILCGCGGGGSDSSTSDASPGNGPGSGISNAPTTNAAPTANAGAAQTALTGATVTLDGSGSRDPDGTIASYAWTQTAGPTVALVNGSTVRPTFTAPQASAATTYTFSLVVVDNLGAGSSPSTVSVVASPAPVATVAISGVVRFARVFISTTPPIALNYANPILRPARFVQVEVLDADNLQASPLATGSTGDSGAYSLDVPSNRNVVVRVIARMQQSGPGGFNVRVQDGVGASTPPYSFSTTPFNSNVGSRDIDLPTGISASGADTGPRVSGPFAILDTILTGIETVRGAAPLATFPDLFVDWGTQNDGTYFTTRNGQHIALASDLTEDTDEFDQHVVAHEFGHYIEANFSRADTLGGSHGLGDRLDARVAFGEGFATAFAAIALNDPVVRDSFVINGTLVAAGVNVEANPATISSGTPNDGPGCWCSEASVSAILWDIYDSLPDTNDGLALGFGALWQVLTGAQRTTPAVTSIFSFIEAFKIAQPAHAAAVDTLVGAQNIDSPTINAFATNETHAPYAGTLPLFTDISVGAPVVVRSINDGGIHNTAGNHRLLRFTPVDSRTVVVTMTTSNTATDADPDFRVFRSGVPVGQGLGPGGPETAEFHVTAGIPYVIDAYDCANGCAPKSDGSPEGTPGDYDLTITIVNK